MEKHPGSSTDRTVTESITPTVHIQSATEYRENPAAVNSCRTGDGRTGARQRSSAVPAAACTPCSVDGEAQGAVHLLADEPRRAALCRGPRAHPVREQRSLLGRRLGQLRLLQLSATQGHRHTQHSRQDTACHDTDSEPPTARHSSSQF